MTKGFRPPLGAATFIAAVASGVLLALTFPRLALWPLIFIGLAPVLVASRGLPPVKSFWAGFLTGLVQYAIILYWLFNVLTYFGGLPWLVALPILFLMISVLSLYFGLTTLSLTLAEKFFGIRSGDAAWILLGAIVCTGLEYFRGFFLTGFPWGTLGSALAAYPVLIQLADVAGVPGLTFLVALVNLSLAGAFLAFRAKNPRGLAVPAALALAALLTLVIYGQIRVDQVRAAMADAPKRAITVVQASIKQEIKWDVKYRLSTMAHYRDLTYQAALASPWLIVWPETALPFVFLRDPEPSYWLFDVIKTAGSPLIFGSAALKDGPEGREWYNRAYLVDTESNILGSYDKAHLVPYGEYVPLKRFFPFIGKITQASGDFRPGQPGGLIELDGEKIGVMICYESIFAYLSRLSVRNGADYLVVMTNDAWFGTSSAPYQHFDQSILRAVETRRTLIRSANTGISGMVLPDGSVPERLELFERDILPFEAPRLDMETIYTAVGDAPAQVMLGVTALFFAAAWLRRKKNAA